jgi:hypothetical protein
MSDEEEYEGTTTTYETDTSDDEMWNKLIKEDGKDDSSSSDNNEDSDSSDSSEDTSMIEIEDSSNFGRVGFGKAMLANHIISADSSTKTIKVPKVALDTDSYPIRSLISAIQNSGEDFTDEAVDFKDADAFRAAVFKDLPLNKAKKNKKKYKKLIKKLKKYPLEIFAEIAMNAHKLPEEPNMKKILKKLAKKYTKSSFDSDDDDDDDDTSDDESDVSDVMKSFYMKQMNDDDDD